MNISQTFIERPIATSLLMAAIALFGSVAYRSLAVSDLPNVDYPTLVVNAVPTAIPATAAMPSHASPLAKVKTRTSNAPLHGRNPTASAPIRASDRWCA